MDPTPRGLKHPFSALSHLAGAVFAVCGLFALLETSHGRPRYVAAFVIYGLSLIALYILSTLYHWLHVPQAAEKRLQQMDHVAIFLLIAGTYTPVCLITLRAGIGPALLAAVWALAAAGALVIICWRTHPHWLRVTLYVLMGWLAAFALPALYVALGRDGIAWMVAGGLAYTVGIYFYAKDRHRDRPWSFWLTPHDIWHLFVLTGSICHYVMILRYVATS